MFPTSVWLSSTQDLLPRGRPVRPYLLVRALLARQTAWVAFGYLGTEVQVLLSSQARQGKFLSMP